MKQLILSSLNREREDDTTSMQDAEFIGKSMLFLEPNLYFAELHQRATVFGYVEANSFDQLPETQPGFCPCCGNPINKVQFPLWVRPRLLRPELSFSYYIFLKLIKKILTYLFLPYLLSVSMTHFVLLMISDPRVDPPMDRRTVDLIFLVYFLGFVKVFLPVWMNRELEIWQARNKSPSEITISVSGLPRVWNKAELKSYLERRFLDILKRNVTIEGIVAFRHCEAMREIRSKIRRTLVKQRKIRNLIFKHDILSQSMRTRSYMDFLEEKFTVYKGKITYYKTQASRILHSQNLDNKEPKARDFRQFAFVILRNSRDKREIISKWCNFGCKLRKKDLFQGKSKLRLRSAPDPNDIILGNVHLSEGVRMVYKGFAIILAVLLSACFYLIIYSLVIFASLKIGNQSVPSSTLEFYLINRVLGSVFLIVINKLIERIFLALARFPGFETFSRQERFSLNLIGFFQLFNTFIMTFADHMFLSFFLSMLLSIFEGELDLVESAVEEFEHYFTTIFFFIIVVPFAHFLNFGQLYKFYRRWKVKRKGEIAIPQKELNKIFENVGLEIIDFYFDFDYIYLLSAFMLPFNPLWVLASIASFFTLYWVYKFLLLRVFSLKKNRSEATFRSIINMIRKGPLVHSLGLLAIDIRNNHFFNEKANLWDEMYAGIVSSIFIMEFVAQYVIFCNSKALRGIKMRKNEVELAEVRGVIEGYSLFESGEWSSPHEEEKEEERNMIELEK